MKRLLPILFAFYSSNLFAGGDEIVFHEVENLKNENTFECLLLGDTYYGESYQDRYEARFDYYLDLKDDEAYDVVATNFREILDESDLNIANLETVITTQRRSPLEALGKDYLHYSDIVRTPNALKRHKIHAVSLANNHSPDFGSQGLRQMQGVLDSHQILHFGAGENRKEASRPFFFKFKMKDGSDFKVAIIGALQIRDKYGRNGFDAYSDDKRPGVNGLDVERISRNVEAIRKIDKDIFIILFPHWGRDYEKIIPEQQKLAKLLEISEINAIIGQGAHTAQPIVKSNGKLTAYNIGNFMFNTLGRFAVKFSTAYSFIVKMIKPLDSDQIIFRFYPTFVDNKLVRYKPRFVGPAEFQDVLTYTGIENDPEKTVGEDKYGQYIEYQLLDHLTKSSDS